MKKENLLSSWKEIASYLDCDVRTCHRWEREHRLPVHRLGETPRSRVFAYKEELDAWMEERSKNGFRKNEMGSGSEPRPSNSLKRRLFLHAAILLAVALAAYVIFFNGSAIIPSPERSEAESAIPGKEDSAGSVSGSQPADFKIEGSELAITDKSGRELFRFDTGLEDLRDEAYYRNHYQTKVATEIPDPSRIGMLVRYLDSPALIIRDLEGDGRSEIVFCPQTKSELGEERIYCFSDVGALKWEYKTGLRLKFGQILYPDQYRTDELGVEDIDDDGHSEIFVIADHRDDFPTQFLVLNAEGKKIGEYWNSGRLMDYDFFDIDGDSRKEILVAGMNNEFAAPSLIVFDQDRVAGSSPQQEDFYTSRDLEPGQEMYHIRFPANLNLIFPGPMEGFFRIEQVGEKMFSVETSHTGIIYYFDFDLTLLNIRLTHRFQSLYAVRHAEGVVSEPFDHDSLAEKLKAEIRYWNGDGWVSTPTMTLYWLSRNR